MVLTAAGAALGLRSQCLLNSGAGLKGPCTSEDKDCALAVGNMSPLHAMGLSYMHKQQHCTIMSCQGLGGSDEILTKKYDD